MKFEEARKIAEEMRGYKNRHCLPPVSLATIILDDRAVELEVQRDELLKALAGLRKAIEEGTFMGRPSYHSGDIERAIGMANAAVIHAIAETEDVALEENKG